MRLGSTCFVLALALVVAPAFSQTTNVAAFNQMLVNGIGVGGTSCIPAPVNIANQTATLTNSALGNSQVVVAFAAFCAAGTINLGANNTFDLDLNTFGVAFDGTGLFIPPNALTPFIHTNAAGNMTLTVPNAVTVQGLNFAIQSAYFNPGYASGFQTSAAFDLIGFIDPNLAAGNPACNAGAVAVPGAGDDTTALMGLGGWMMPFYGVNYAGVFANSNGSMSFGAGNTVFGESLAGMQAAPPRAAGYWDDFHINGGTPLHGTLTFFTDGVGLAELCWTNVPEFASAAGNNNTFKITIIAGPPPIIVFDYGAMTSVDGIVGLTSGAGSIANALNLSTCGLGCALPGTNNSCNYELFTGLGASLNDLAGLQLTWILDAAGLPLSVF